MSFFRLNEVFMLILDACQTQKLFFKKYLHSIFDGLNVSYQTAFHLE